MNTALVAGLKAEPMLADAFAAFTAAAGRLEGSYHQLQGEVSRLREELEERNAALGLSLAENERMRMGLSRILEALPSGVIVLDGNGRVSFVNPEAKRLLGDELLTLLTRVGRKPNEEQEFCVGAESKKRWLVVRTAAGKNELVLIVRDVTAQREMEREREEARRLIALAEMSSVLAHEIRNPLGSMELLSGLLMTSDLGSEQRKWVEHLQAGVRSLSATVNNVLRVHTLGVSSLAPLQIGAVLRSAVRFIAPLADQNGIKVWTDMELCDAEINGNAGELQQVILNLALNAFRHTTEGGQVKIRARVEERTVAIAFSDSGSGIPEEDLEKIFEAGFSTKNDSPGLGLAVCRKIVQQHGGTIAARNQNGATIRMEFPIL
ncbi:MAG TPA: ATP-binding protein [Terriglobales bacterium]|nr:ATP-binding protein [Terriglobales bacterium]